MITVVVYVGFYFTRPTITKASCSIISKQVISDITLQVVSGIPLVGETDTTPYQRLQKVYNKAFLITVNKFINALVDKKTDMEKLSENYLYYQNLVDKMTTYQDFLKEVTYHIFLKGSNEIVIEVVSKKKNEEPVIICAGFALAFLQDGYNDANLGFKKQLEYYKQRYEKHQEKLKSLREAIPIDYVTTQENLKILEGMKIKLQEHISSIEKGLSDNIKTRSILYNIVKNDYLINNYFDDFASGKTKELRRDLENLKVTLQSELAFKNSEHPQLKKLSIRINAIQDAVVKSYREDIINWLGKTEEKLQSLHNELAESTTKLKILQEKIEKIKMSLANVSRYIKEEEQLNKQTDILVENMNKYKTLLELNKSFVDINNPPRLISTTAFSFGKYFPTIMLLGLFLGFVVAYLIEYLQTNIVSEVDVKKYLGYECIGIVPLIRSGKEELVLLHKKEHLSLPVGEIFKAISSLLVKKMGDIKSNCIVISGIERYEGKTTACINLAYVLANVGYKCALIDMDLRTKNLTHLLHKYFGADNPLPENMNYISIEWEFEEMLKKVAQGQFDELLNNLKVTYDFIIVDAPPTMSVGETPFIIKRINNLLLLIASGQVSKAKSRWFKHILDTLGVNVVGVILNKSPLEITPTYYYYYKYGYSKR
ncbi:MAG: division plane positioning ATPase MipZ [Planctomycetota bacterium]